MNASIPSTRVMGKSLDSSLVLVRQPTEKKEN